MTKGPASLRLRVRRIIVQVPIYEYECKACGGVAEVMQKMSAPGPETCVTCHQGPMVKIMSRTAFVLKGEGWYVTDFRDKKKAPAPVEKGAKVETPADAPAGASDGSTPAKAVETAAKTETSKPDAPVAKPVEKPASN